jgi:PEP-CTERM motif
MRKRMLALSVTLGLFFMMGAVTASADQITLGASDSSIGTLSIDCPGGMAACTMTLVPSGTLSSGSALGSSFNSPTDSSVYAYGDYSFTGGPNTLQSSNGGISFVFGGPAWTFTFTDTAGDSLTADVDWTSFFSASSFGFQVGQLDFSTLSISCPVATQFCTDFANGGSIDITLKGMDTDLATLWNSEQGGSDLGVTIESGSVNPNPAVPEPGSLALFGSGLIGIAGYLRRKITRS